MSIQNDGNLKADLLLVDGNSLMNRAYFGLAGRQNLSAPDGTPTGAIFAFFNIVFRYMDLIEGDEVVACFDRPEPTFRHQYFEDYKSGRSAMPDDLAVQMPLVKEGLRLMGCLCLEKAGYEADDLIATIAAKAEAEGKRICILSGDRDLWQLISEQSTIIFPFTSKNGSDREWVTPEVFREKYGFDPPQLLDLKALMGDSSDAIPGVKGIGEKSGIELIRTYGSLDGVYGHLEEIKGAKQKKLREGEESARLSYRLASLFNHVPLSEEEMVIPALDPEGLDAFLTGLGIQKFRERFGLTEAGGKGAKERRLVWSRCSDLNEWIGKTSPGGRVALVRTARGSTAFFNEQKQLCVSDRSELNFLWDRVLNQQYRMVIWGTKELLRSLELAIPDKAPFDCEIAAYLLNDLSGARRDPELDFVRAVQASTGEAIVLERETTENNEEEEAVLRAEALFAMEKGQCARLRENGQDTLFFELELPLSLILARMEQAGIRVDKQKLKELSEDMLKEITVLEDRITESLGEKINLNSSKQLSEILFGKLGLPGGKKKKDGSYSTAADELEKLTGLHPAISLIQEYREISKLRSTFVEGLKKNIAQDGRIHTTFRQTLTSTGRLSSADPNLQNIPTKSDRADEVRRIFIPETGCLLLDADYSQIELRLLAVMSGDEQLQKAFSEHRDIHRSTAARLFGKAPELITDKERRVAKTVNFSIVYGISDFGLSRDLQVTVPEARQYIRSYDSLYPQVHPWMKTQVDAAKKDGYVTTMLGRRRVISELKSANYQVRQFGERAAMNAPVQGSAADLIKLAMVKTDAALRQAGLRSRLILQVHDELLLECPADEVAQAAKILKDCMENAMKLEVPLEVSLDQGENWHDMTPVRL